MAMVVVVMIMVNNMAEVFGRDWKGLRNKCTTTTTTTNPLSISPPSFDLVMVTMVMTYWMVIMGKNVPIRFHYLTFFDPGSGVGVRVSVCGGSCRMETANKR